MQEICSRDPTIKLFGMKIPLSVESDPPPISEQDFRPLKIDEDGEEKAENKDFSAAEVTEITEEEEAQNQATKNCKDPDPETSTESNVKPKTPPVKEESTKSKTSKTDREENEEENNTNTEEKTLKKPDKILPCPRCNSMDTKFCYYNNYNVNQPRHFCKACQRYWTAGGTMRNVPVGAGRRKNKNSASHYRHITISEALQTARIDPPNGRVLSFGGVDSPLHDSSVASVFNLAEKKPLNNNGAQNGRENGDDCSSGSSVTVSNSNEEERRNFSQGGFNRFLPPIPYLSGVPWPYQLPPAFCPPGFPLQYYPPIWNCGGWNIPTMLSPQSSTTQKAPVLGKHSRNGEIIKPCESDKHEPETVRNGNVLVPKILRIDDPNEAAKSSIWTTLGIKNESSKGGKLFKAFQPKTKEKNHINEASPVSVANLANPAALSRSMNFHESS